MVYRYVLTRVLQVLQNDWLIPDLEIGVPKVPHEDAGGFVPTIQFDLFHHILYFNKNVLQHSIYGL